MTEQINTLSRDHTEITFTDQWGEQRVIHRAAKGKHLQVKSRDDTLIHTLNRAAAVVIGERIKARRLALGLTATELHNKAGLVAAPGLEKNRIYEIETAGAGRALNKKRRHFAGVRFGTLYALAIALECEPWNLMPTSAEVSRAAGVEIKAPLPRLAKA